MEITWILVAHRSGAKLYEKLGKELNLLQELAHPEGKLQDKEMGTDKPGRAFDRVGGDRHSMGKEQQKATEQEMMRFVRELVAVLEEGRTKRRYHKVVLIAEPRFLGELRSAMTPQTAALISVTQSKDLASMDHQAVKKYLQDVTWPPAGSRQ